MINEFNGQYLWLSNFWLTTITYEDIVYPSVENAFQASKYDNSDDRFQFISCSPGIAQRLGRKAKIADIEKWDANKDDLMKQLISQKFLKGSFLADKLLGTYNFELIDGNTWNDTYWGVCNGIGENRLGKIIMSVRAKIQSD